MKRSFYLLVSVLLFMVACAPKQETVKFIIASKTADCTGEGKQKCMLVKKGDQTDWEFFYSQIQGFNYEEGYEYVIEVKENKLENPPMGASAIEYVLVKEVSKTKKESENLPIMGNAQDKYQWGGKVLGIEETALGRGAAEGQFPATVISILVTTTSTDLFHAQDTIHAELVPAPRVKPEVGKEYVFKAKDAHPAHAKGIYMLNTDVQDLI